MAENEKYLDSVAGKLSQLKNAWQDLWDSKAGSELIKEVLDITTNVVKLINKLGGLKTILVEIGAIIAGYNMPNMISSVATLITKIKGFVKLMSALETSLKGLSALDKAKEIIKVFKSISAKKISLSGLDSIEDGVELLTKLKDSGESASLSIKDLFKNISSLSKAALSSLKPLTTLLATGVSTIVAAIIHNRQQAKQEQEEMTQNIIQHGEDAASSYETLADAQQNYLDVTSNADSTEEEVQQAIDQVTEALGNKADALDDVKGKTEEYTDALKGMVDQERENAKAQLTRSLRTEGAEITDATTNFLGNNNISIRAKYAGKNEELNNEITRTLGDNWTANAGGTGVYKLNLDPKKVVQSYVEYQNILEVIDKVTAKQQELIEEQAELDSNSETYEQDYKDIQDQIEGLDGVLDAFNGALSSDLIEKYEQYGDDWKNLVDIVVSSFPKTADGLKDATDQIIAIMTSLNNGSPLSKEAVQLFTELTQDSWEAAGGVVEAEEEVQKSTDTTLTNLQNRLEQVRNKSTKTVSKLSDEVNNYKTMQEEFNDSVINGTEISADQYATLQDLFGAQVDLSSMLHETTAATDENTESTDENTSSTDENTASTEASTSAIVDNATALKVLINNHKELSSTYKDIEDAQATTESQYRDLQSAILDQYTAQEDLTDSNMEAIDALTDEADRVSQLRDEYTALKLELTETSGAYQNMQNAQAEETRLDFSSQVESMFDQIGTSTFNRKYGAPYSNAVEGVVPEEYIEKFKKETGKSTTEAVSQYVNTLVKKGLLTAVENENQATSYKITGANAKTFAEMAKDAGVFTGDIEGEFSLSKDISSYQDVVDKFKAYSIELQNQGKDVGDTFELTTDQIQAFFEEIQSRNKDADSTWLYDQMTENALPDEGEVKNKAEAVNNSLQSVSDNMQNIISDVKALRDVGTGVEGGYSQDIYDDAIKLGELEGELADKQKQIDQFDKNGNPGQQKTLKTLQDQKDELEEQVNTLKEKLEAEDNEAKTYSDIAEAQKQITINENSAAKTAETHIQEHSDKLSELQQKAEEYQEAKDKLGEMNEDDEGYADQVQSYKDAYDALVQCYNELQSIGDVTQDEVNAALQDLNDQLSTAKEQYKELHEDENGKQKYYTAQRTVNAPEHSGVTEEQRQAAQEYIDTYDGKNVDDLSSKIAQIEAQYDECFQGLDEEIKEAAGLAEDNPLEIDTTSVDTASQAITDLETQLDQFLNAQHILTVSLRFEDITAKTQQVEKEASEKLAKTFPVKGDSNAKGTKDSQGGTTLVGEKGRELVVDVNNGKYTTVGDNGPEFVNLPKHAIVYNNEETEQLLKKKKTGVTGRALASGTKNTKKKRDTAKAISDSSKYDYSNYQYLWSLDKDTLLDLLDDTYKEAKDFDSKNPSQPSSIDHTQYGNIDVSNRQAFNWTDENKKEYANNDTAQRQIQKGYNSDDYSTVLGNKTEREGYAISYSPFVEMPDQQEPVLLDSQTIEDYFDWIIETLDEHYGKEEWDLQKFLDMDHQGTYWDTGNYKGVTIHDLVAGIHYSDDDQGVAQDEYNANAMHYSGQLYDIVNILDQKYGNQIGTEHLEKLKKGQAYIRGGKVKNSNTKDLIGELGPELVVDPNTGTYSTMGTENGAQLVDLPKDAIIFNAEDTKKLLKGQDGTRGVQLGNAFVKGNAYAGTDWTDTPATNPNTSTSKTKSSKSSDSSKALKDAQKEVEKTKKEIQQAIDDIISSLDDAVSRGARMLVDTTDEFKQHVQEVKEDANFQEIYENYASAEEKLKELQDQGASNDDILDAQKEVAESYEDLEDAAEDVGLSTEEYINLMNGSWDGNKRVVRMTIKDELDWIKKLVDEQYKQGRISEEQYDEYCKEYYDKTVDMYKDVYSAVTRYTNKLKQQINTQTDAIDRQITKLNRQISSIDRQYELAERPINDQIKALEKSKRAIEAQKTAIEDQIYALEKQQKEIEKKEKPYKEQIKLLEKQSKELDKQKQALEDQVTAIEDKQKPLNKQIKAIEKQTDLLSRQKEEIEKSYEAQIDPLNDELEALQKANEEREDAIDLQEKQYALNRAMNQKTQLVFSGGSFTYQADQSAVKSAQKDLDDAEEKKSEKDLSNKIDSLEDARDNETDAIDAQNEALEEQQQLLQDQVDAYDEQIEVIEDSIEVIERQQDQLQRQEDLQQEQIDLLEEQIDAIQENIDMLQEQEDELDRQEELINRQIQSLNDYIDDLEEQKELQERVYNDLIEYLEKEKEPLEDRVQDIEDWETALETVKDTIENMGDETLLDKIFGPDWQTAISSLSPQPILDFASAYQTACTDAGTANDDLINKIDKLNQIDFTEGKEAISDMTSSITGLRDELLGASTSMPSSQQQGSGAQGAIGVQQGTNGAGGAGATQSTESSALGSYFAVMGGIDTTAPKEDMDDMVTYIQDIADNQWPAIMQSLGDSFAQVWSPDEKSEGDFSNVVESLNNAKEQLETVLNSDINGTLTTFQSNTSTFNTTITSDVSNTINTIQTKLSTFGTTLASLCNTATRVVTDAAQNCINQMQSIIEKMDALAAEAEDAVRRIKAAQAELGGLGGFSEGGETTASKGTEIVMAKGGEIDAFASGGTTKEKTVNGSTVVSAMNTIARSMGEDVMIAVRRGERVLSQKQTADFDQLVKLTPDLIASSKDLVKYGKLFKDIYIDTGKTEQNIKDNAVKQFDKAQYFNVTNNNNNITMSVGDINVQGVQDVDGLARAIKNELPNKMLQILTNK